MNFIIRALFVLTFCVTQANAQYLTTTGGSATPSGAAGGDLSGTYPSPTLATIQTGAHTWLAAQTISANGAASVPSTIFTGTLFTGGTATTTFPQMLFQPTGTSAVTSWSTSGTGLGMNLVSGFAGNFLDFHMAGAASVFNVTSNGTAVASGGFQTTGANQGFSAYTTTGVFTIGAFPGDTFLTRAAAASWRLGAADVASGAIAQTLTFQGNTGAATTGPQTIIRGAGGGSGASIGGELALFGGVTSAAAGTGGAVNIYNAPAASGATATLSVGVSSAGLVTLPKIASDAALTDTTVCQDTTNHGLRSGSGALGVCLGTSGRQFKLDIQPMTAGLDDLMKISLVNYHYKDGFGDNGARLQYGVTAQDVEAALPDLARHNLNGETINFDSGALLFIGLRAIQQLKTRIDQMEKAR